MTTKNHTDMLVKALEHCREILKEELKEIGHDPSVGLDSRHIIYAIEHADDALEAHRAAQSNGGWMPLQGMFIDVDKPVLVYHAPSQMTVVAYLNEYGEWRHIDGAQIHEPTHVMPLPAAPAAKDGV